MEFQTIKEKGKVKFVVLPVDLFEKKRRTAGTISDRGAIREAKNEPLHDQKEAEDYIFMNPVKKGGTHRTRVGRKYFIGAPRPKTIDHSQMGKKGCCLSKRYPII